MKVKKLIGYEPAYPMKKNKAAGGIKLGAIAAAAAIAVGSVFGCRPAIQGDMEVDPASLESEQAVVTPAPTDEFPELLGEPVADPSETSPDIGANVPDETEELWLMGDVATAPGEDLP